MHPDNLSSFHNSINNKHESANVSNITEPHNSPFHGLGTSIRPPTTKSSLLNKISFIDDYSTKN